MMRRAVLWGCVSLAGCHSAIGVQSGAAFGQRPNGAFPQGPAYEARVSLVSRDRVLTGIVVAILLAEGVRYYFRGDDGTMTPLDYVPEPDPARTISEQDCTGPVNPERGNLMCR